MLQLCLITPFRQARLGASALVSCIAHATSIQGSHANSTRVRLAKGCNKANCNLVEKERDQIQNNMVMVSPNKWGTDM